MSSTNSVMCSSSFRLRWPKRTQLSSFKFSLNCSKIFRSHYNLILIFFKKNIQKKIIIYNLYNYNLYSSHAQWVNALAARLPSMRVYSLPGLFHFAGQPIFGCNSNSCSISPFFLLGSQWKARLRSGAPVIARQLAQDGRRVDVLLATSMCDVASLLGLVSLLFWQLMCWYSSTKKNDSNERCAQLRLVRSWQPHEWFFICTRIRFNCFAFCFVFAWFDWIFLSFFHFIKHKYSSGWICGNNVQWTYVEGGGAFARGGDTEREQLVRSRGNSHMTTIFNRSILLFQIYSV